MLLPPARGSLGERVLDAMMTGRTEVLRDAPVVPDHHDDAQLTLWALYELHYRGFEDVDDRLEWDPALIAVRRHLEDDLEQELRARYARSGVGGERAEDIFRIAEEHEGPSLASFVHRHATREQVLELLRSLSVYHLKESDWTQFIVPRLGYETTAAVMELQFDEYGNGDPNRLHSHLFAEGMAACGLDPKYGTYVAEAPAEVLEENNVMSLFGLQRRLRGAGLGFLAAFEATSSLPCRRMAQGLDRLGMPEEMQLYYREHVEADAVHEQLAVRTICGSLLREDPSLIDDVLLGAWTCLDAADRVAHQYLGRWGVEAAA